MRSVRSRPALRARVALAAALAFAATLPMAAAPAVAGPASSTGRASAGGLAAARGPAVSLGTTSGPRHRATGAPGPGRDGVHHRRAPRLDPRTTGTIDRPILRTPTATAAVVDPVQATTSGAPAATRFAYAGLASADNNTHHDYCNGQTLCLEPPDPWVAVGPGHVVESVNRLIRVSDRKGSTVATYTLAEFFGFLDDVDTFDPRVIYDAKHGRWLATEAGADCTGALVPSGAPSGFVDLAVSHGSDPTGEWDIWSVAVPDTVLDYPSIGTSGDKVVISTNEFDLSTICGASGVYQGARRYVFDWDDLLAGVLAWPDGIQFASEANADPSLFTWRPATALGAPTDNVVYGVVEVATGGASDDVGFGTISGSVTPLTISMSAVQDLTTGIGLAGFTAPPAPAQPGGTISEAVDQRPTDAVLLGKRLAFSSTLPCTPTGDIASRACARVTELDVTTATPTRRQDFVVAASGADSYLPGVGYAGDGTLHVAWTRSSAAAGAATFAAYQRTSDALATLSTETAVAAAGASQYVGTRWGDYVGVAQDPLDPSAAWIAGEATASNGSWSTAVAEMLAPAAVYVPITPVRVLDTRTGIGLSGAFAVDVARSWQVTGVGGIPASAVAVTANVTVVGQTVGGFVTVAPAVTTSPATSTVNFPRGDVRANNTTIPLTGSGRVSAIYETATATGSTHLLFDVTGYFTTVAPGATYKSLTPARLLDTRTGNGLSGRFLSGQARTLQVTGRGGVPSSAVAITGNLTVVGQSLGGYLSITPTATGTVTTSTLNFPYRDVRANGFAVRLGTGGKVGILYKATASGATTDVVLDVTGYFLNDASGLSFVPLPPGRRLDTRSGLGLSGTFLSGTGRALQVRPFLGVANSAAAVTANLTVVGQTAGGLVSITPTVTNTATTSTLNFPYADVRANGVFTQLSGTGGIGLLYLSGSGQRTNLLLDVTGYFR